MRQLCSYLRLESILLVLTFLMVSWGLAGQEFGSDILPKDRVTYDIWTYTHSSGVIKGGFLRKEKYYEEDRVYIYDYDLVRSLPIEEKKIIVLYASFVWYLFDKETDQKLAQALGGFSTLAAAREALLKDWNNTIQEARPYSLKITRAGNTLYAEWGFYGYVTDEFRIDGQGEIIYIPEVMTQIPYDKNYIDYHYTSPRRSLLCKLNTKPVNSAYTYLDADNIESVKVSERDRTVYITQKDKEPVYFSLKGIDLSEFNVEIKKKRQIREIYVIDKGKSQEYFQGVVVEMSAISHITSEKYLNHDLYKLKIWLK